MNPPSRTRDGEKRQGPIYLYYPGDIATLRIPKLEW